MKTRHAAVFIVVAVLSGCSSPEISGIDTGSFETRPSGTYTFVEWRKMNEEGDDTLPTGVIGGGAELDFDLPNQKASLTAHDVRLLNAALPNQDNFTDPAEVTAQYELSYIHMAGFAGNSLVILPKVNRPKEERGFFRSLYADATFRASFPFSTFSWVLAGNDLYLYPGDEPDTDYTEYWKFTKQ